MEEALAVIQTMACNFAEAAREHQFRQQVRELDIDQVLIDLANGSCQFVDQEFREGPFTESARRLHRVQRLLAEWETLSRNDRLHQLEEVQSGANDVVRGLQSTPSLVAVGPFVLAATLQLHVLYLRYRLFQSELGLLRSHVGVYSRHLLARVEELQTQASRRYAVPAVMAASGTPVEPAPGEDRRGGPLRDIDPAAEARDHRRQDMAAGTKLTLTALSHIAQEWRGGLAEDSIRQAYCRVLERPVDDATLTVYREALRNGLVERHLVRDLALSEEHLMHLGTMSSPEATVDVLFDHLFARKATPPERVENQAVLSRRGGKGVIEDLLQSVEYDQRFGDFTIPGNGRAGCF